MIQATITLSFTVEQHEGGQVGVRYKLDGLEASIGMMNFVNLLFSASQAIGKGDVDMEGEGEGAIVTIRPFPLACLAEVNPEEGAGPHDTLSMEQ